MRKDLTMNGDANCEQLKPALLEFLMEEISPDDRRKVERHLESCHACAQELAELKQTMSLVARAENSEEIPRRIRIMAEPPLDWMALWRNPARLAFGSAGLLCVAIALFSLSHTTISYRSGNFQIAFGAAAAPSAELVSGTASSRSTAGTMPAMGSPRPLERREVYEMISQAMAAAEAERQRQSNQMAKEVSQRLEQRWQHDLGEMSASLRYFQAAETMLYKGQVQSQQLVSALMQQTGTPVPQQ